MKLLKLAEVMKERDMTAEQLAGLACVSFSTAINAMKGLDVSANTGYHIAHGLKMKLKELT
jgi:transcriptional regulator with XRE-family HTH domain